MSTRRMTYPAVSVSGCQDGLLITFRCQGSRFGPVEVVLDVEAAEQLIASLNHAQLDAGATPSSLEEKQS